MTADKKSIIKFLIIAFAGAWLLQTIGMVVQNGMVFNIMLFASTLVPLIAAAIVCGGLGRKKSGINFELAWSRNWKVFFIAWVGGIAVIAVCAALYYVLFPSLFDPQFGYYVSFIGNDVLPEGVDKADFPLLQILEICFFAPFLYVFLSIGEEVGFRGYLTPALSSVYGRKNSIVISGILWGLWYSPLILFVGYEYGTGYPGAPFTGVIAYIVYSCALGILLCLLYEKSDSIWIPAMCSGTFKAVAPCTLYFLKTEPQSKLLGPSVTGIVSVVPLLILSIVLLLTYIPNKNASLKNPFGRRFL